MPVELIDEQELYEALRPYRPDRAAFELGVQDYLRGRAALAEQDPIRDLPPLARAAAAVLPLPLLTGKAAGPTTATGVIEKIFGILLFPAVSFFLLLGASFFSYSAVRNTKRVDDSEPRSAQYYEAAIKSWWREHRLAAFLVWGVALLLIVLGATDWLFFFFIVSLALVVAVVRGLAARQLGNRQLLAGSLMTALILLAQGTGSISIGDGNIHFLDQRVVSIPFWLGVIYMGGTIALSPSVDPNRFRRHAQRFGIAAAAFILVPLMFWSASSILWTTTPGSIRRHVEAFDRAKFHSATWQQWEIPARWAIEAGLSPDLTKPRALLAQEVAGKQDPYVLGSAFRTGLVHPEQVAELRDFQRRRDSLLGAPDSTRSERNSPWVSGPISSPGQQDWVIRALILIDELSDADRDHLAARLHATLQASLGKEFDTLEDVLTVTQLLAAIDRPVRPEQYRKQVHNLLRDRHTTNWGGFALAGGFSKYGNFRRSDPASTADAVELMQIYGVPEGLDLNWVRSYAKPRALGMSSRWTNAVTRQRLAAIPGVQPPTWWQWLYYERNLLAAVVLVGLCIYAVWLSPVVHPTAHKAT